jgi:hypothetical protein
MLVREELVHVAVAGNLIIDNMVKISAQLQRIRSGHYIDPTKLIL